MSIKHDLQMFVTVVVLAIAAACSLFQKEVPLSHVIVWHSVTSSDTSMPVLILQSVDTRTREVVEYEGDIKGLELTGLTISIGGTSGEAYRRLNGEIAFAEVGSTEYTVLGDFKEAGDIKSVNTGQEGAVIVPDTYASQKLSEFISKGRKVTFRLKAMADSYPPDASVTLTINSKMMVEI